MPKWPVRLRGFGVFVSVWLMLFGLAVALQIRGGAYESDFGAHPDEASHFVTGLMVRDYLMSGFDEAPMEYAQNYYAHYPKVAIGHYPPAFYLVEGIWLSIFPVEKWSVLWFMAAQSGLLGCLVFAVARRRVGGGVALLTGLLVVALPLTQDLASTVMSDLLLSLSCLAAVLAFARFLQCGRWQDSLLFGMFAAVAALVKGSGLFLALFVPLSILVSGRWDLLRRPALWVAALPVVIIAGPWYYFTTATTAEGMVDKNLAEHLAEAFPYFAIQSLRWLGWVAALLAAWALASAWRQRTLRTDPLLVCLLSTPVALVCFYALTPAGLDPRYLMPMVAPVLLLAAVGAGGISDRLGVKPTWLPGMILLGAASAEMVRQREKDVSGWGTIAGHIVENSQSGTVEVLVVSDARGEGALVAEMALLDPCRPSFTVERGSKILSSSDWLGRDYKGKFATVGELEEFFEERKFQWTVVDGSVPGRLKRPYHDQVHLLLSKDNETGFEPTGGFSIRRSKGCGGKATVIRYRR